MVDLSVFLVILPILAILLLIITIIVVMLSAIILYILKGKTLSQHISSIGTTVLENKLLLIITAIFLMFLWFFYNKSHDFSETHRATIYAALIAFVGVGLAFLGIVYQSKYRINVEVLSKNRQEWINELRKELSSYSLLVSLYVKRVEDPNFLSDENKKLQELEKGLSIYNDLKYRLCSGAQKAESQSKKNSEDLIVLASEINYLGLEPDKRYIEGLVSETVSSLSIEEIVDSFNKDLCAYFNIDKSVLGKRISNVEMLQLTYKDLDENDRRVFRRYLISILHANFTTLGEIILKNEWERVKKGK